MRDDAWAQKTKDQARLGRSRQLPKVCPCGQPAFNGGYCSVYCSVAAVLREGDESEDRGPDRSVPSEEHDRAYHGRCGDDV